MILLYLNCGVIENINVFMLNILRDNVKKYMKYAKFCITID